MWTPPCACMCIDNMDTGHRVLSAPIAEQELQHSGPDSTHGWKIEPRDEIWSFVAFCASAVCSRSGTGVKQTHLTQKNEVTHQQVWRLQWVKTCAGRRSRGGEKRGISGKKWFAKIWNMLICLMWRGIACSTRLTEVPRWLIEDTAFLFGQWWEK